MQGKNKEKLGIFFCGALGVISVELFRLYKLGMRGDFIEQYLIVIPILILLGGFIPVLLKETNRKKAFYFSLSFLTAISAIFSSQDNGEPKDQNESSVLHKFLIPRIWEDKFQEPRHLETVSRKPDTSLAVENLPSEESMAWWRGDWVRSSNRPSPDSTQESFADSTMIKVADFLAADKSEEVRELMARARGLSDSTIRKLSVDEVDNIRIALASNSAIPSEKIRILTKDENVLVRLAMVDKIVEESKDEEIMITLAKDSNLRVRTEVAKRLFFVREYSASSMTSITINRFTGEDYSDKNAPFGFWKKTRLYLGSLF